MGDGSASDISPVGGQAGPKRDKHTEQVREHLSQTERPPWCISGWGAQGDMYRQLAMAAVAVVLQYRCVARPYKHSNVQQSSHIFVGLG
jgi:hypothetical protein